MDLKFYLHLLAAVALCVWFALQFVRHRRAAQLVIAIWAPLTLLTYLSPNKTYQTVLGVVELLLFFVVIFLLFRAGKPPMKTMLDDALEREPEDKQEADSK